VCDAVPPSSPASGNARQIRNVSVPIIFVIQSPRFLQFVGEFVTQSSQEVTLMYVRLAFWTVSMAYTSVLLSRGTGGSSPGVMITAALLGAAIGFGLGGMFVNRRTRKRG
jgi:uncharacterized membrane protein